MIKSVKYFSLKMFNLQKLANVLSRAAYRTSSFSTSTVPVVATKITKLDNLKNEKIVTAIQPQKPTAQDVRSKSNYNLLFLLKNS